VPKARRISNWRVADNNGAVRKLLAAWLGAAALAMVAGAATCRANSVVCDGVANDDRALYTPDELSAIYRHSPLGPLPPDSTDRVADDPRAAVLGQTLFFDSRFSANGRVSCATCHDPARAFTDGRPLAKGIAVGTRNAAGRQTGAEAIRR
jgi:cytochrome c peroxidase